MIESLNDSIRILNTSTFKLAALSASITASSTPLAARFLSVTMSADVLPSA